MIIWVAKHNAWMVYLTLYFLNILKNKLGETENTNNNECEKCEVDKCSKCSFLEKNKCL